MNPVERQDHQQRTSATHRTLLLVEDENDARTILARRMAAYNWTCLAHPSAESALKDPELRHVEAVVADVVLGDRYGTSCDRSLIDVAEVTLRRLGYAVERNRPYAGGFITEHYGHPATHRHALQIEINRALYMDERTFERKPRFAALMTDIGIVVGELTGAMMTSHGRRAAAE